MLLFDLADTNLHPVLGEHNVLLLHFLAGLVRNFLANAVGDEADDCDDAKNEEEDDDGDEVGEAHDG